MSSSPHGFQVESVGRLDLTTGKWLSPADVLGKARGARLINDGRGT